MKTGDTIEKSWGKIQSILVTPGLLIDLIFIHPKQASEKFLSCEAGDRLCQFNTASIVEYSVEDHELRNLILKKNASLYIPPARPYQLCGLDKQPTICLRIRFTQILENPETL